MPSGDVSRDVSRGGQTPILPGIWQRFVSLGHSDSFQDDTNTSRRYNPMPCIVGSNTQGLYLRAVLRGRAEGPCRGAVQRGRTEGPVYACD
jgi:hypothetical protein